MISAYRADIDGLRAVAVLLVVICHLGLGLDGGFIGVDVFFVISGYLITGIVRRELQEGRFSFAAFYTRRARRILPALVAVCLFCLAAGPFLLLPSDLESLGAQVVTAVLGVSNVYFALNTGYFDQNAELLPLLHTWSLGVEEQFYLLWPLLLLLLHRRGRATLIWIGGGVFFASLAAAQVMVDHYPEAAFYLPFTRAWELALGAALTWAPRAGGNRTATAASIAGMALILVPAFLYSDSTEFPGLAAIAPCLGAALILWPTAQSGVVNRVLTKRPFVWVGKISYSLYLWHWPILVFTKQYSYGSPSALLALVLLLAAVGVSALSWKYIEQPFRQGRYGWRIPAVALAIALTGGVLSYVQAGFPGRLSPEGHYLASFRDLSQPLAERDACNLGEPATCRVDTNGRNAVLLIGDSHARHFINALVDTFPSIYLSYLTRSQCRPVIRTEGRDECVEAMKSAYNELIPATHYDAVILSARWRNGQADQIADSVQYLKRFTDRVIIFGQTVEYEGALPDLMLSRELLRAPVDLAGEPPKTAGLRALNAEIEKAARAAGAEYYDPLASICTNGSCQTVTTDGTPLQADYGHLTLPGSTLVLERFKAAGLAF